MADAILGLCQQAARAEQKQKVNGIAQATTTPGCSNSLGRHMLRHAQSKCLVHLLDCGATAGIVIKTSARHATGSIRCATCSLVHLHHDGIHDALKLFLLCFKLVLFGKLILVKPIESLLNSLLDLVLVVTLKLVLELLLLEGVAHGEAIIFQTILCLDFDLLSFIFGAVLLSFLHHAINFSLRQTSLLVGDGNLVGFACRLVLCRNVQDAICVNVEGHLDLWDTTRSRW